MNTPEILFYAKMVNTTKEGNKTLKYTIVEQAGFYPPMESLRGKDGNVSFYLMEKLKEGQQVPSMRLQAKDSLNFTGLKEWFVDGKLSGYAYGYPYDKEAYSKKGRPNPFYEYRKDGFLFLVHQDEDEPDNIIPSYIELVVLKGAKLLISSYCKQLEMGGFDEVLAELRKQAKNEMSI